MEWRGDGVILGARSHGEANVVVELFTRDYGRHLGLVRGGNSRKQRPLLQMGNAVSAEWRARLSEHLGSFKLELLTPYSAQVMDDRLALAGLGTLCSLARLLPERDPHGGLYDGFRLILSHFENLDVWPALLVRWEMELLSDLGFGMDLSCCAATGSEKDLIYVSPKTGRAVSAAAGEPYKDKLLALPAFLSQGDVTLGEIGVTEVLQGFQLTGFFLSRHVMEPRGIQIPESRERLIHYITIRD